jgi:hypothetical protein
LCPKPSQAKVRRVGDNIQPKHHPIARDKRETRFRQKNSCKLYIYMKLNHVLFCVLEGSLGAVWSSPVLACGCLGLVRIWSRDFRRALCHLVAGGRYNACDNVNEVDDYIENAEVKEKRSDKRIKWNWKIENICCMQRYLV